MTVDDGYSQKLLSSLEPFALSAFRRFIPVRNDSTQNLLSSLEPFALAAFRRSMTVDDSSLAKALFFYIVFHFFLTEKL